MNENTLIRLLIYVLFKRLDKIPKCILCITIFLIILWIIHTPSGCVVNDSCVRKQITIRPGCVYVLNAPPHTRTRIILYCEVYVCNSYAMFVSQEKIHNVKSVSQKYRTLNAYEIFLSCIYYLPLTFWKPDNILNIISRIVFWCKNLRDMYMRIFA